MEHFLRLQINELLITIIGLEKVSSKWSVKDFTPINNLEQAKWIAKKLRLKIDENATPDEICQRIVDFNNETGYMFRNRSYQEVVMERKKVEKLKGNNPNRVAGVITKRMER